MTLGTTLRRVALEVERRWDARQAGRTRAAPRFESYDGHGTGMRVVVRGRLLRDGPPDGPRPGEHVLVAARRTIAAFTTTEVPRARVRVRLGAAEVEARTDDEGYLAVTLDPALSSSPEPWREGRVVVDGTETPIEVRVPSATAGFGVVSDLDDTIVETSVLRPLVMLHRTLTGSALTRRTFPGAAELYRRLEAGPEGPHQHPFFYVSSSPWNLHAFLVAFLEHHGFPRGPIVLRDLLGSPRHRRADTKRRAIEQILDLHPDLKLMLIGDSGEEDANVYAQVVRDHPERVLAVAIHEVRPPTSVGRPGARVDRVLAELASDVPVLLTRDFAEMARWATSLGLVDVRS